MSLTYYQEHREKIIDKHKTKVRCPCGMTVAYGNLSCHRKSARHLIFLQMNNSLSLGATQSQKSETP